LGGGVGVSWDDSLPVPGQVVLHYIIFVLFLKF